MHGKTDIEKHIIGIAVFTSILSFSPNHSISRICNILLYLFWIADIGLKSTTSRLRINMTPKYMLFVFALFTVMCRLFCFLGFYPTPGAGIAKYLGYCAIFYIVGYNFNWTKDNALYVLLLYLFLAYFVLTLTSMAMVKQLDGNLFFSKNQLGQMLGSAVIFETFILPKQQKKRYMKLLLYICSVVSLIVLMDIHSRTPLIALVVVTIVTFILKKNKTNKDYWLALGVIVLLVILIMCLGGIDFLKELFEVDSDTNINSAEGINDVTSGRIDGYSGALNDFINSPVFGLGAYAYIDNFIICTLRTGGIFLASFILPFIYGKLYVSFRNANNFLKKYNDDERINVIMFIIRTFSIYFFVISLMEGYPPVGPGTSVFLLWLMMGMAERIVLNDNVRHLQDHI